MSLKPEGTYWFISLPDQGFPCNDENAEKIRAAMMSGVGAVEIVAESGATIVLNPSFVMAIEESTPAVRDAVYIWNRTIDELASERRKRLGEAAKDYD